MPYKDPKKQAAAQRRYREKRLDRARERDRERKKAARAIRPQKQYYQRKQLPFSWDLDLQPEHAKACNWRFFAPSRCKEPAVWVTRSATRYCDEHAKDHEGELRRIDDAYLD